MSNESDWFTPRQLVERHAFLSEGGLRKWIYEATKNGFDACIRRLGRKIVINNTSFLAWVDAGGPTGGAAKIAKGKRGGRRAA